MKCSNRGHWNRVPVNKIFLEQPSPEPKVQVLTPMYEPLEVSNCEKCGKVIASGSVIDILFLAVALRSRRTE